MLDPVLAPGQSAGADDHNHLMSGPFGGDGLRRGGQNFPRIGNAGAAEFLHDQ